MTKIVGAKSITQAEARLYAAKAEEYLEAANAALAAAMWTAAASLAVHAGINAADAITGFTLGQRAGGDHHDQALTLLRSTAKGSDATRQLRPLLKLKPKAQYEPTPIRRAEAETAVRRATKLLEIVHDLAPRT